MPCKRQPIQPGNRRRLRCGSRPNSEHRSSQAAASGEAHDMRAAVDDRQHDATNAPTPRLQTNVAGGRRRVAGWLVGLAGFAFLALGGWMIYIRTDKGTLTLEVPQDNVQVSVQQTPADTSATGAQTAIDDQTPRYEGRTFAQWRQDLLTERSLARVAQAVDAMLQLSDVVGDETAAREILTGVARADYDALVP